MTTPGDEYIKAQREGNLSGMAQAEEHAREALRRDHIERGLITDTDLKVDILMEIEFEDA